MSTRFDIDFSPRALENLHEFRKRDQQIIVDTIESQLSFQPDKASRNRKKLIQNPLAPWELRIGDFRVFFDVVAAKVIIVAIGQKRHNRLVIGGEEIVL